MFLPKNKKFEYFSTLSGTTAMDKVPWLFCGRVYGLDPETQEYTDDAEFAYNYLLENLNWNQGSVKMFGKLIEEPRLTCWYASEGKTYTYAGKKQDNNILTGYLLEMNDNISEYVSNILHKDIVFNSVHCNYYRDGKQYIGYHADDEKGLGPYIASLSLGAKRRFIFQHKETKKKIEYQLSSGDLLIMGPGCQKDYKHTVPKELRVTEGRINLTFRTSL